MTIYQLRNESILHGKMGRLFYNVLSHYYNCLRKVQNEKTADGHATIDHELDMH